MKIHFPFIYIVLSAVVIFMSLVALPSAYGAIL